MFVGYLVTIAIIAFYLRRNEIENGAVHIYGRRRLRCLLQPLLFGADCALLCTVLVPQRVWPAEPATTADRPRPPPASCRRTSTTTTLPELSTTIRLPRLPAATRRRLPRRLSTAAIPTTRIPISTTAPVQIRTCSRR